MKQVLGKKIDDVSVTYEATGSSLSQGEPVSPA